MFMRHLEIALRGTCDFLKGYYTAAIEHRKIYVRSDGSWTREIVKDGKVVGHEKGDSYIRDLLGGIKVK